MATWQAPWRQLLQPGVHWTWVSVVLYLVACLLPAMHPIFGDSPIQGWVCVAVMLYYFPPWWANPAYYLSLILAWIGRRRAATVCAVVAAILACSFELMDIANDGWVKAIMHQEIGCYVWIASLQIQALNLLWQEWLDWRQRRDQLDKGTQD